MERCPGGWTLRRRPRLSASRPLDNRSSHWLNLSFLVVAFHNQGLLQLFSWCCPSNSGPSTTHLALSLNQYTVAEAKHEARFRALEGCHVRLKKPLKGPRLRQWCRWGEQREQYSPCWGGIGSCSTQIRDILKKAIRKKWVSGQTCGSTGVDARQLQKLHGHCLLWPAASWRDQGGRMGNQIHRDPTLQVGSLIQSSFTDFHSFFIKKNRPLGSKNKFWRQAFLGRTIGN